MIKKIIKLSGEPENTLFEAIWSCQPEDWWEVLTKEKHILKSKKTKENANCRKAGFAAVGEQFIYSDHRLWG